MAHQGKGRKFWGALKWGALGIGLVITYATGHLVYLGMAATAAYVAWQVMKGAPWDRASVMPAGLWGGAYGAYQGIEGQSGPIDFVVGMLISAIIGIILVWLVKFGLSKAFR